MYTPANWKLPETRDNDHEKKTTLTTISTSTFSKYIFYSHFFFFVVIKNNLMFMIFLGPMLQCFLYRFEVGDEYLVWRVVERDLNEILLTWEFKGVKVCVPEQYILAFLSLFLWFYVPYRDSVQSCFGFSILSN